MVYIPPYLGGNGGYILRAADVITLNLLADRAHSWPSISQIFEDEEWNNLNPIYESFKTVKKYYHEWYYKNKKINQLNLIK